MGEANDSPDSRIVETNAAQGLSVTLQGRRFNQKVAGLIYRNRRRGRTVAFGALWRRSLSLVASDAVVSDGRLSPQSPNCGVVGSGHVSSLGDADSARKSTACFGRTRPSAGGLCVQRPA